MKCSRSFPRCANCTTRRESCSLASWKPAADDVEKGKGPSVSGKTSKRKLRQFPLLLFPVCLSADFDLHISAEPKPQSPTIDVTSSRSTRSRPTPGYRSDSEEEETVDSPALVPTPATITTSPTTQSQPSTSQTQLPISPSPSASRQPFTSPPAPASQTIPHSSLPPRKATSQSFRTRKAICKAFVEGEAALRGAPSEELDFDSLSTKLIASCPTSPESSCIFFPSSSWTYSDIVTFPDSTQATEALSNYFQYLEPSLRLFPTNQSRRFLYEGCKQWWTTGTCSGGVEWQALYLATVASSAVVSSDDHFNHLAQGWMYLASRMVLSDQRKYFFPPQ